MKIGDTVQLKSGGPLMTIDSLYNAEPVNRWTCVWFKEGVGLLKPVYTEAELILSGAEAKLEVVEKVIEAAAEIVETKVEAEVTKVEAGVKADETKVETKVEAVKAAVEAEVTKVVKGTSKPAETK